MDAPTRSLAALLLTASVVLAGCGGEEPGAELAETTDGLVEASRERYEASAEFKEAATAAEAATAEAEAALAEQAPVIEASIEDNLATATTELDAAKAALGRQADDLFGEVEAAIAERRYPQAQAALETLKGMPNAEGEPGPGFTDRIAAAEAALEEAQSSDETLGSAKAAIDAAKATAAETPTVDAGSEAAPEIGQAPEADSPVFSK